MSRLDVPASRIVLVGAGIAVVVALAVAVAIGLLRSGGLPASGMHWRSPFDTIPQRPRLQSAPQLDMKAYSAEKETALNRFGWVDAASGVAHIPIDDAMALIVAASASASASASLSGRSP